MLRHLAVMVAAGGLASICPPSVAAIPLLTSAWAGLAAIASKQNEDFDAQMNELERKAALQVREHELATDAELYAAQLDQNAHFQKQLSAAQMVIDQVRAIAGSQYRDYFHSQMELPSSEGLAPPPGWGQRRAATAPAYSPQPQLPPAFVQSAPQPTPQSHPQQYGHAYEPEEEVEPQYSGRQESFTGRIASPARITQDDFVASQYPDDNELFRQFMSQPHNWICGPTGGGKTFLLLRLLKDWIQANPDGRVYVLDRNFGKPDRVTGEPFLWNGLPQNMIYSEDDEIVNVLQVLKEEMKELIAQYDAYARGLRREQPLRPKVMIIVTEWNALADATKTGAKIDTSPAVEAMRPILQQGNGYGYKVVLDGQTIAVAESGISTTIREQLAICMVGASVVNTRAISNFGCAKETTQQIYAQTSALRAAGKRACIIQVGTGEPVVGIVPEMGWLRDFRFASEPEPQKAKPAAKSNTHARSAPAAAPEDNENEDLWDDAPEPAPQKVAPVKVAPQPKVISSVDEALAVLKEWMGDKKPNDQELQDKISELLRVECTPTLLFGTKRMLGLLNSEITALKKWKGSSTPTDAQLQAKIIELTGACTSTDLQGFKNWLGLV